MNTMVGPNQMFSWACSYDPSSIYCLFFRENLHVTFQHLFNVHVKITLNFLLDFVLPHFCYFFSLCEVQCKYACFPVFDNKHLKIYLICFPEWWVLSCMIFEFKYNLVNEWSRPFFLLWDDANFSKALGGPDVRDLPFQIWDLNEKFMNGT